MLPYNQQIANYQYPELDFSYPVLGQQEDKDTNKILRREFTLFEFNPTTQLELEQRTIESIPSDELNPPTDPEVPNSDRVIFKADRRIDKINIASQYTWTLNNMKDAEGNLADPKWEYNKFKGWEKRVFNMLHSGDYDAEIIGSIAWGTKKPEVSTIDTPTSSLIINIPDSIESPILLDETINGQDSGSITIQLPDTVEAIQVIILDGGSEVFWVSETSFESIPLGAHFLKSNIIKLVLPASASSDNNSTDESESDYVTHLRPQYSLNLNTTIDLESYLIRDNNLEYQTNNSNRYIKINLLKAKLAQTTNLKVLETQPVEWEIKDEGSIDYNNPLPVTPINIPINLEVFN